jgi:hypothetical protein
VVSFPNPGLKAGVINNAAPLGLSLDKKVKKKVK